jgi:hypothetical protein
MELRNLDEQKLITEEKNLINIELALDGLSTLLEETSNSDQNQTHKISCCNAILKTIIKQVQEVTDTITIKQKSSVAS